MKKITKVLFGFGSIVAVVAPLSATIACDGLKDDYEDEFKVKEVALHSGLGVITGGKSDNEWSVAMKQDKINKEHLIKVINDKLWLTPAYTSIGNEFTIKTKDGIEVLKFSVVAINRSAYKVFMLEREIRDKLNDAITKNNADNYFTN